jgi:hypothetical protein
MTTGFDSVKGLDLTGQKFGRWTVLGPGDTPRFWNCQCDCGQTVFGRRAEPNLLDGSDTGCPDPLCEFKQPRWVSERLEKNHADVSVLGVYADWLDEHTKAPQSLVSVYRYMGLRPKYPARRPLGRNLQEVLMFPDEYGWGWYSMSDVQPWAVIPNVLKPAKRAGPGYRARDWVWASRQEAFEWFVRLWLKATDEARQALLREVIS